MLSISKCLENVHVVKNPINVVYGSSAHMRSDLQCMKLISLQMLKEIVFPALKPEMSRIHAPVLIENS
jgi:hypothetical protein